MSVKYAPIEAQTVSLCKQRKRPSVKVKCTDDPIAEFEL